MTLPMTLGGTVPLAVTSTSARVALSTYPAVGGTQVIVNALSTGALAFIKFGDVTVVADDDPPDYPIQPGSIQTLTLPGGATHVAAKTAASTASLYFTVGQGE